MTMRARLTQMARFVMASMFDEVSSMNFKILMSVNRFFSVQQTRIRTP